MDAKLNYSDLSAILAKQYNISATKAESFVKYFFDTIIEGLQKDGIVKINGLGTFKIIDVASRSSVDVNTGAKIEIKGHRKLTFIPSDSLKEKVNMPFAAFEPVEVNDDYEDEYESADESSADEVNIYEQPDANEQRDEENVIVINDSSIDETENIKEEQVVEEVLPNSNIEDDNKGVSQNNAATDNYNVKIEVEAEKECVDTVTKIAESEHADNKQLKFRFIKYSFIILLCISFLLIFFYRNKEHNNIPKVELPAVQEAIVEVVDSGNVIDDDIIHDDTSFVMIDELANMDLSSITSADTLLYKAIDTMAIHRVGLDETLTKIALKYYNDKKFWPYIVEYNDMGDFNRLEIGMEILIPRLVPRKK